MESKKLRKITREFNKWRYPECRARTLNNEEDEIIIKFDGTFNYSCCFDEHFEDYRIMLEEEGEKYTIKEVKQIGKKFIVKYEKEDKNERRKCVILEDIEETVEEMEKAMRKNKK